MSSDLPATAPPSSSSPPPSPPRVFISYAHDSAAHRDTVLALGAFLRSQGVDAVLDTWFAGDRRDWHAWTVTQMGEADYVIVVASPQYRMIGDGLGSAEVPRSVQSEAALLRELVIGDRAHWLPKVLPVILTGDSRLGSVDDVPLFLQPATARCFPLAAFTVPDAMDLLRVLLRQPAHVLPPVQPRTEALPDPGTPATWGDGDRLPAPVRGLLRAQERRATELPYRLPGARTTSLATVYVRQELGTGSDAAPPEQPRTEPMRDGKVPRSLPEPPTTRLVVRPPSRPIHAALDGDDHLLVTGGPGRGKSTLSLRLAAEAAAAWASGVAPLAEPVVPVRLTARELASRLDLPSFPDALAACVRVEYGALPQAAVTAAHLADRVAGCRWLVLIDGLDEVATAGDRERLAGVLGAWASDPDESPYRIVLTTRPIEGTTLAPFQRAAAARYELLPFDEKALEDFACAWFADEGSDTADRFVRQLRRSNLDELVREPLLATIAAIIYSRYPGRPLPDNQYELYETYLDYLLAARALHCSPFAELRVPLLEHLGRVRLDTDTPLMSAARTWYSQHVPAAQRPPDWHDALLTFLMSVGPLTMRGDQLRFWHHSFAEHIAATSMARNLPAEFSADNERFVHLLHAAQDEDRGRYPRMVLLHWTRLRPDQADQLLQSLHAGAGQEHLLAARLLAQHMPASAEMVERLLTAARNWVQVGQYPSAAILRNATRVTHHPGLVPWLVGLCTDQTAPWPARITAAVALGRRSDDNNAGPAVDLLNLVVNNSDLPVSHRLQAAEDLAECGVGQRAAAAVGLRSLLSHASAPGKQIRSGAVVLAGLGSSEYAYAVDLLLGMLDDPWMPTEDVVDIAAGLAEIGLEFHEVCAPTFCRIIHGGSPLRVKVAATRALFALGHPDAHDGVRELTRIARSWQPNFYDRAAAVEAIGNLGTEFLAVARSIATDLLNEPTARRDERITFAYTIIKLGDAHQDEALETIEEALAHPLTSSRLDSSLADALISLGPDRHAHAARVLLAWANNPLIHRTSQTWALRLLGQMGLTHRTYAINELLRRFRDESLETEDRLEAVAGISRLDPTLRLELGATALTLGLQAASTADVVRNFLTTLPAASGQDRHAAIDHISQVLEAHWTDGFDLVSLASFVSGRDTVYKASVSQVLLRILLDPARPEQKRAAAASGLVRLDKSYHQQALSGLRRLLEYGRVPASSFLWVPWFAAGSGPRGELAKVLSGHLHDTMTDPQRIVDLAVIVLKLSDDHLAPAVDALRRVLTDNSALPWPRFQAAEALGALETDRRSAVATIVALLTDAVYARYTLRRAATSLTTLGCDTIPLVRGALTNPHTDSSGRQDAAVLLSEFGRGAADEAADELLRQAHDATLSIADRSKAFLSLIEHAPHLCHEAIAFHQGILDDVSCAVSERCRAAEVVAQLDQDRWTASVAVLRRFLVMPLATCDDRLTALRTLDELKAVGKDEKQRLTLGLVAEPTTSAGERRQAIRLLRGLARLDTQREALIDLCATITDRVPESDNLHDVALLHQETEAALRDVLHGPEFRLADRIAAAAELATLHRQLMPETMAILLRIAEQPHRARNDALASLAWLDGLPRRTALELAEATVMDTTLSGRSRQLAADTLMDIEYRANPAAVEFLRASAASCNVG
jgi:cellulose synthase operon protein C